jgi:hypothetical protein
MLQIDAVYSAAQVASDILALSHSVELHGTALHCVVLYTEMWCWLVQMVELHGCHSHKITISSTCTLLHMLLRWQACSLQTVMLQTSQKFLFQSNTGRSVMPQTCFWHSLARTSRMAQWTPAPWRRSLRYLPHRHPHKFHKSSYQGSHSSCRNRLKSRPRCAYTCCESGAACYAWGDTLSRACCVVRLL